MPPTQLSSFWNRFKSIAHNIWKVLVGAENHAQEIFLERRNSRYPICGTAHVPARPSNPAMDSELEAAGNGCPHQMCYPLRRITDTSDHTNRDRHQKVLLVPVSIVPAHLATERLGGVPLVVSLSNEGL